MLFRSELLLGVEGDAELVLRGESIVKEERTERGGGGFDRPLSLDFQEVADLPRGEKAATSREFADRRVAFPALLLEEEAELFGADDPMPDRQDPEQVQRRVGHFPLFPTDIGRRVLPDYRPPDDPLPVFSIPEGGDPDR